MDGLPGMQRDGQGRGVRLPEAQAEAKPLMVELATSSWKQYRPGMGVPVRITLGKPRFKVGFEYEEIRLLAPTPAIFRLKSDADFEREYLAHLDRIGAERLRDAFDAVSGKHRGRRLVLLCYESVVDGEVCHRRMFAQWWEQQTGQDVPESAVRDRGISEHNEREQPKLF